MDIESFKNILDKYLENVQDLPVVEGYISHNLDHNSRPSNMLLSWNCNLKLDEWTPPSDLVKTAVD